jgi:hypothetical protein
MPQLFDYSGIGQNYLRDQALQQEIEQRKKSFPISNALASAQLQDYLRNQQDTAAIRQTAQQNNQMTVNPEPPKPDAFGNMQLNQSGAPNQTENTIVAVFKKYISQGKIKEATDTLDTYTKPMLLSGNVDEAARVSSRALGVPLIPTPDRKDIMIAPAGSMGYNLKTGKTEFTVPNKPENLTGADYEEQRRKAWLVAHPGKTDMDYNKEVAKSKDTHPAGVPIKSENLGNVVRNYYADGTTKDEKVGVSPNTQVRVNVQQPELGGDTIQILASDWYTSGQAPFVARTPAAIHALDQVAKEVKRQHPDWNPAITRANYGADKSSLASIQKSTDAINSFETTALKNADLMMGFAQKLTDTKSPIVNRYIRDWQSVAAGDPNVRSFEAARRVFANEVAKITSNPNMSGVLTNEARQEIDKIVSGDVTLPQLQSIVSTLKKDMENRRTSLNSQIGEIKGRISGTTPTHPADASGGGGGTFTVNDPNGKPHYFTTQQDADNFKKAIGAQ